MRHLLPVSLLERPKKILEVIVAVFVMVDMINFLGAHILDLLSALTIFREVSFELSSLHLPTTISTETLLIIGTTISIFMLVFANIVLHKENRIYARCESIFLTMTEKGAVSDIAISEVGSPASSREVDPGFQIDKLIVVTREQIQQTVDGAKQLFDLITRDCCTVTVQIPFCERDQIYLQTIVRDSESTTGSSDKDLKVEKLADNAAILNVVIEDRPFVAKLNSLRSWLTAYRWNGLWSWRALAGVRWHASRQGMMFVPIPGIDCSSKDISPPSTAKRTFGGVLRVANTAGRFDRPTCTYYGNLVSWRLSLLLQRLFLLQRSVKSKAKH